MTGHDKWRTWDKDRDCRGHHQGLDGWLRCRKYENFPKDSPPDEDKTDDEQTAAWEHESRHVKRKLEMQTSSSFSLARPGGETVMSHTVENTPMQVEQHV